MLGMKFVLDKEVGEYLGSNERKFTNNEIAKILSSMGYEVSQNFLGDYMLSPDAVMTAIMLKYLEYSVQDMNMDEFRRVWVNTKNGNYSGIEVIFHNILDPNKKRGELSRVIALLESKRNEEIFKKTLGNVEDILIDLEMKAELEFFEEKIRPMLSRYYKLADEFRKQKDAFYENPSPKK